MLLATGLDGDPSTVVESGAVIHVFILMLDVPLT
jgi:hypothetical protein